MANQIQVTVYQIDGNPLSSPIEVSFLTSNIYIREYQIGLIPEVNAAIVYYPNTSNQLQEQTFFVSESASTLIAAANVNGTTQVSTTVLEINQDPQIPGGLIFSFPAQGISIWSVAVPIVGGVNSFLEFKNKKYYLLEDEATLVSAANAGGGGGGGVSGNGTTNYIAKWSNVTTLSDSNLFDDGNVIKSVYGGNDTGTYLDFGNKTYLFGEGGNTLPYGLKVIFDNSNSECSLGDITNNYLLVMLHILPNQIETRWNGWTTGLNLDYTNGIYRFGDYGNSNKGIYLNIDDTNSKISTFYSSSIVGLDMDLINDIYYFGATITNGTTGFKADNNTRLATIGDTTGNGNGTNFGTNDIIETLFASPNLITNAGSLPSGNFLKINVGGTDYLISLNNAG